MHFSTLTALFSLTLSALAAPKPNTTPLPDGYPAPNPAQLKAIEKLAGGNLPNGPLPTKLTATAVATLQLIALNEAFEVAYFGSLLHNITTNAKGYDLSEPSYNRTYIIDVITQIQKQEELHLLGANGILQSAHATTVAPCNYKYPVTDFLSAITLANTFTDVVIGVLPQAQTVFASDAGDELPLVNLLGSIITQESEQNGYFRSVQQKVPSAAPFLTTEGPSFAFTFLKAVIEPGCPGVELVDKSVPTYKPLTVVTKTLTDKNQTVTYSVEGHVAADQNEVVYLSGQNLPLSVPITKVTEKDGVSTFEASLPFEVGFAKGLTIAAVTDCHSTKYDTIADVAKATHFGPGIIEID